MNKECELHGARIFVLFTDVNHAPRTQVQNSEDLILISTTPIFKMMGTGYRELSPASTNLKHDSFEATGFFCVWF